jgi:hypothetical protein
MRHKKTSLIFALVPVIIILIATMFSCGTPATGAALGEEFTLAIGQSKAITGENITIKFLYVTADSRCPGNVTCIWAGEVSCMVEITRPGASLLTLVLTEPGLTDQPSNQQFDGHSIAFRVNPYPTAGKQIAKGDYRLSMTVTAVQYSVPELKYQLLANFSTYFWCDPDLYPVARQGQEQANALEQFPTIMANTDEFSAILKHLNLAQKSQYNDDEKLQIYRQHKILTYALQVTPSGNVYNFSLRVGTGQGESIQGTITSAGLIKVTVRESSVNTCPICLSKGTLIHTPDGPVPVESLRVGMSVWTFDASGKRSSALIIETSSTPVPVGLKLVRVALSDGRTVTASPGHPGADGRPLGGLSVGEKLDGATVLSVEDVAYNEGATYDILPSGNTGLYHANGLLLKSTLLAK